MSEQKVVIEHLYQPQEAFVSIKVERGQRGGYGWEIKAQAKTVDVALGTIADADEKLKQKYLENEKEAENG